MKNKGFTLLELVVAVGIMLIIGAAATPLLLKHLRDAKVGNLNETLLNIRTAFNSFYTAQEGVPQDTNGDGDFIDDMLADGWLSSSPNDTNFTYYVVYDNNNDSYYIHFFPKTGKDVSDLQIVQDLDGKIDGGDGSAAGVLQWIEGSGNLNEAFYKLYGGETWH